jgi:hypothetical protein
LAAVGIAWSLMPGMIAVKTFGRSRRIEQIVLE